MALQLKALGIDHVMSFDFISQPSAEAMMRGLELLYALGAVDDRCRLTPGLGEKMAGASRFRFGVGIGFGIGKGMMHGHRQPLGMCV
jgi:hypothetical protein